MTPDVVSIINTLIGATAGVILTFFFRSFKEWRDGRKDEAQKQAAKVKRLKDETERAWNEYLYLRRWILSQPLTEDQLERIPKPPE